MIPRDVLLTGGQSHDVCVKTQSMGGNDLCGVSDISVCREMRLARGSTNGRYLHRRFINPMSVYICI